MASKSSSIISIIRRLHAKNVMEPLQPRLATAFASSIHTTAMPKWTIGDNVLPRMVGAGNFQFENLASNCRNYARKPVSKDEDDEVEDSEDEEDLSFGDLDDEIDEDDDEEDESDETESDEK